MDFVLVVDSCDIICLLLLNEVEKHLAAMIIKYKNSKNHVARAIFGQIAHSSSQLKTRVMTDMEKKKRHGVHMYT